MKLYPHPLYKRTRTFGDPINPTFRGVNKSMSSSDFIPVVPNRTYLLMLVPSTLVKEGGWYSAEFEPIIVCKNNEPVSSELTNTIVKLMLSYLSLSQSHNVVSIEDNPEFDANVKVVVELNQLKSTGTNIKLRFTTRTPLAGAEDILVNQPENFAFKLEPHVGDMLGYFNQFSGMFLVDPNKPDTLGFKPIFSDEPKYEDLPRNAAGEVADIVFDNSPNSYHWSDPIIQVIKVDYGVIVSDSLNQLVGLKIDLESGTWRRDTDGGDWIKD